MLFGSVWVSVIWYPYKCSIYNIYYQKCTSSCKHNCCIYIIVLWEEWSCCRKVSRSDNKRNMKILWHFFRMYCEVADDKYRRSAQTVQYYILNTLVKVLAPVIPHMAEEAFQYHPFNKGTFCNSTQKNYYLEKWLGPQLRNHYWAKKVTQKYIKIWDILVFFVF